mgnify:CR=1 FL=1
MPDDTPILGLPLILPAQAQKHVTHNEALRLLDILVQLAVLDRDLATPPALPAEGDRYIVAANPTAAWAGQAGNIAAFWGGIWVFISPRQGWTARVTDENIQITRLGSAWVQSDTAPETTARLGISTAPDATNRLAVASPASLFTHAGSDHRMVLNKATATDTTSILLQTGFSGRAEIGLAGSNDLTVKVSADGTSFATGLTMQPSGAVSLPEGVTVAGDTTLSGNTTLSGAASLSGPVSLSGAVSLSGPVTLSGPLTGSALQSTPQDGTAGKLMLTGAFGLGSNTSPLLASLDATTTLSGQWRTADTATTGTWPAGATTAVLRNGIMTVLRPDATTILQCWLQTETATEWTRRHTGTTWSVWARSLPVTGTVSMVSGQPTGAIIQRGSTATGDFIRFADGTQICTHSLAIGPLNLALGSIFQGSATVTWTFPAAFSVLPVVSGLTSSTSAWVTATPATLTNIALRGCSGASLPATVTAYVTATGRWV